MPPTERPSVGLLLQPRTDSAKASRRGRQIRTYDLECSGRRHRWKAAAAGCSHSWNESEQGPCPPPWCVFLSVSLINSQPYEKIATPSSSGAAIPSITPWQFFILHS